MLKEAFNIIRVTQYAEHTEHTVHQRDAPTLHACSDRWCDLWRRAWCAHADWALPPLLVAVITGLCYSQLLPFWGLLLATAALFVGGVAFMAVYLAGA